MLDKLEFPRIGSIWFWNSRRVFSQFVSLNILQRFHQDFLYFHNAVSTFSETHHGNLYRIKNFTFIAKLIAKARPRTLRENCCFHWRIKREELSVAWFICAAVTLVKESKFSTFEVKQYQCLRINFWTASQFTFSPTISPCFFLRCLVIVFLWFATYFRSHILHE